MIDRRRLLFTTAAGAGMAAIGTSVFAQDASATGPAQQLRALMDATFEKFLDESPETVTAFGLDTGARAAAKSKLSMPSKEEEAKGEAMLAQVMADLSAIDRSALTGQDAIWYDTVQTFYGSIQAMQDRPYARGNPSPYRVSQQDGAWQSIPDFINSQHTIQTAADADAYVARVEAYAQVLRTETERLREDYALGVVPPDFILDNAISSQKAIVAIAAGQSSLVDSVARRAAEAGLTGDWGARVERLVTDAVYPALAEQTALLEQGRATATHDAGIWRLPDAEEFYSTGLKFYTTTDLTPDEIHAKGVEHIRDLTAQADVILKAQGFTQGTVAERLQALGRDPSQVRPNTDEAKEEIIAVLNGQMEAIQARLPNYFGRLPKSPVIIRRVPKEIEQGASLGYYQSPSLDGTRPGQFFINLRDTAEYPTFTLATLCYHEAAPGHHLQIALQQESESAPLLMNMLFFGSYIEGWGLYAEQLADEMGVYENDPLSRLGYLQSLLFRSARLVVDTGLHHKRWTREQGIQFMVDAYGDQPSVATSEVDRYCASPAQACSYKVGHDEWVRLREKARSTLGNRFDINGFHDVGLAGGGVPLSVLERVIDGWTATQRG